MSALANILVDLGYKVSGVDYNKKYFTEATFNQTIVVESFDNYHLDEKYFYIIGNAFKLADITEEIKELGYHFEYYPSFLENFFKMKKIGVSGSHGKTTTTSFACQLIKENINVLIGDGTGKGNKDSKYFLFEACEYQNHFLSYTFDYLVILNIDYDHPDFFKNMSEYSFAFQKAALNSEVLIINGDCEYSRKIVHKNKITFGFKPDCDIVLRLSDSKLYLMIEEVEYEFDFPFYAKHMAYNLAASIILTFLIDKDLSHVNSMVKKLRLPARRFNEFKVKDDAILIDDYAHHPTEIKALINTIRLKYPDKFLVVIYQGHTYSRTISFFDEYVNVLKEADEVYIMPIFSSVREEEFDEWALLRGCDNFKKYDRDSIESLINGKNIVVAFIGAGDINNEFIFLIKKVNY